MCLCVNNSPAIDKAACSEIKIDELFISIVVASVDHHWNTPSKVLALTPAKTQMVMRLVCSNNTMRPWWQIFLLNQQLMGDLHSIMQLLVMEIAKHPSQPSSSPDPTQFEICNQSKETDNIA
jgi:hypothetical protein